MSKSDEIPSAFQHFFEQVYQERWSDLLQAMLKEESKMPRKNKFSSGQSMSDVGRGPEGLLDNYFMDLASIEVAKALAVQQGNDVLDMCAAPGGKTLVLVESLSESGNIIANEISEARRQRLTKVIRQYVPRNIRDRVRVSGKDGGKFALTHKSSFDRILVDAPCSGERHLLKNKKELDLWTESRSKKLAQRQYALLTAALLCLRENGRIVYSTCSISPVENDQVIDRLLEKKTGFQIADYSPTLAGAEKTKHGWIWLPDRSGHGPIYLSVLEKI